MKTRFWAVLPLIAMAVLARVIPHPANVTPIVGLALFSGAFFSIKNRVAAVLVPLIAMFVSDLAIGMHSQMVSVYGSIVLISLIGFVLSEKRGAARIAGASIAASTLFFVITNFTVWLSGEMYAKTGAGLLECYTLALPFYRNGLLGDLAYSVLLFGAWALLAANADDKTPAKIKGMI